MVVAMVVVLVIDDRPWEGRGKLRALLTQRMKRWR